MTILTIDIERQSNGCQCGTLTFSAGDREGKLLWMTQWRRAQKVTVEFIPAEGATQQDVRDHYNHLVDSLVQTVFERVSRKALFS